MIPYIIINGFASKDVNGLLIQSLAPISKPAMRIEKEEIDGRDGDIVTPLGYEAYNKAVTIGLKGDYNIDDIIEFFNTSGQIIFSNEPDKYYNFAVYDQIDFNRLVRFRTAVVNFYVQPFKYALDMLPIIWENPGTETIAKISVRNTGNIYSRPKLIIVGKGDINLYINNVHILDIALPNTEQAIIIDGETMNATDEAGNYLNRIVTGDYNDIVAGVGVSSFRITGQLTSITIDKYSRWI